MSTYPSFHLSASFNAMEFTGVSLNIGFDMCGFPQELMYKFHAKPVIDSIVKIISTTNGKTMLGLRLLAPLAAYMQGLLKGHHYLGGLGCATTPKVKDEKAAGLRAFITTVQMCHSALDDMMRLIEGHLDDDASRRLYLTSMTDARAVLHVGVLEAVSTRTELVRICLR